MCLILLTPAYGEKLHLTNRDDFRVGMKLSSRSTTERVYGREMIDTETQFAVRALPQCTAEDAHANERERHLRESSLLAFARFGAGVIHEINNPLAVALLSAQIALRALPRDEEPGGARSLNRAIEMIRMAANAVRDTIRDCAECAAAQCTFDVRDVLRFAIVATKSRCEEVGCHLECNLSPDACTVNANPIELEIGLANFIYGLAAGGVRRIEASCEVFDQSVEIYLAYHCDNAMTSTSKTHLAASSEAELQCPSVSTGADELLRDVVCATGGMLTRAERSDGLQIVTVSLPHQQHHLSAT
jgi:hypothetical protein